MPDKDSHSSAAAATALANKHLWQVPTTGIVERNKVFLGKELLADVHLVIAEDNGDKVKLPAHRYILSVTSWIFYNSFHVLHLNDFQMPPQTTVEDARTFLEYCYTDEVALDRHNVYALLRLALNFEMPHLEQLCIAYIEKHLLTIENVIDILGTAYALNSMELQKKTRQVIEWTIRDVMRTRAFLNARRETVEFILDMPQLNCTEFQLYQGVIEWAANQAKRNKKALTAGAAAVVGNGRGGAALENDTTNTTTDSKQLKRREILDKCLYKIRFPTMTAEEFSECAKETELLTADEIRVIFLKIMNKTSTNEEPTATATDEDPNQGLLLFSAEPRQIKLGFHVSGIWIFNRFVKWSAATVPRTTPATPKHSTLVRVNKPVVVVGLGILMRHDDLSLTDISIQINGRHEALNEKRTDLMYRLELENGLDIVRILLDQPVFLETDEVYLIQIVHARGNLLDIEGQVRDTIVNEDLEVTFVKPKQSPYINSIAEVFIHKG